MAGLRFVTGRLWLWSSASDPHVLSPSFCLTCKGWTCAGCLLDTDVSVAPKKNSGLCQLRHCEAQWRRLSADTSGNRIAGTTVPAPSQNERDVGSATRRTGSRVSDTDIIAERKKVRICQHLTEFGSVRNAVPRSAVALSPSSVEQAQWCSEGYWCEPNWVRVRQRRILASAFAHSQSPVEKALSCRHRV